MADGNMKMLYAAYGSNLHPARLRARVPSAKLLGTAAVAGLAVRFDKRGRDGSAKCNVVERDGEVYVAVYEVHREHKRWLDRIEGLGVGYRCEVLDVIGYGECFTYAATEGHVDESLQPYSWYKELVLVGCDHHRFPRSYRASIRAVASLEDPDRERHAMHMAMVRVASTPR